MPARYKLKNIPGRRGPQKKEKKPKKPTYGRFSIVRTASLPVGDDLFYVPLRPVDRPPGRQYNRASGACVRRNREHGTVRCEACRSRDCAHARRLAMEYDAVVAFEAARAAWIAEHAGKEPEDGPDDEAAATAPETKPRRKRGRPKKAHLPDAAAA